MRSRGILFGTLVFANLVLAAPVHALQGIGVSPTSQEQELAPGESTSGQFTIINDGDLDVSYHIYATDYKVKNEDYQGSFTVSGDPTAVSATSWFKLPTGTFVVKAHQEATANYTLTVPKAAVVGGHYAAVFVETVPPPAKGGAIISRVERLGSIFYIAVTGQLHKHGSILPLAASRLQMLPPVHADLRVKNDGNVHFLAEGNTQLSTPFGNVGKPVNFKGEVLPGTTRKFGLDLPATTPIGLYKATATVRYLDQTTTVSRWVVLMPRPTFIIVSGTVLLLLGLGFWQLLRRRRKR